MRRRPQRFPETWNPRGPLPAHCAYRVDPTHWAAQDCLGVWLLGRGVPQNLITGEIAVAYNTANCAVGAAGPAWTNTGTAQGWEVRNGTYISGLTEWTIVASALTPTAATAAGGGRAVYAERASTGNDITKLDWGPNNRTQYAVVWRNTAGSLINPSPTGDTRDGVPRVIGASMQWVPSTTTTRVYADGALDRTDSVGAANVTQSNTGKRATIGYDHRVPTSSNFWGDIAMVAIFAQHWSAAQHAAFGRAPFHLLIPEG